MARPASKPRKKASKATAGRHRESKPSSSSHQLDTRSEICKKNRRFHWNAFNNLQKNLKFQAIFPQKNKTNRPIYTGIFYIRKFEMKFLPSVNRSCELFKNIYIGLLLLRYGTKTLKKKTLSRILRIVGTV